MQHHGDQGALLCLGCAHIAEARSRGIAAFHAGGIGNVVFAFWIENFMGAGERKGLTFAGFRQGVAKTCDNAAELCIGMAGTVCLWTGVMEVLQRCGLARKKV